MSGTVYPTQLPKFVSLPDGRQIAYRELGCPKSTAQKSLVVLHGLVSSRNVAMPGATEDLMEKHALRMIAIDRPGYGRSDPHPSQTFKSTSQDIAHMIDELDLGEKVWLLGFSMGGAYCWGSARYLADKLAGIAMVSPVGNFWWKGIAEEDQRAIVGSYSVADHLTSAFVKRVPFPFVQFYAQFLSDRLLDPFLDVSQSLSIPDRECLVRPGVPEYFLRDREESLRKHRGFGLAKDYELINKGWDFDLQEVGRAFKGKKIHVWQGDRDSVVPCRLQKSIHKVIPDVMELHELRGEGHFSWFCFNPAAPHQILATLFEEPPAAPSSTKKQQQQQEEEKDIAPTTAQNIVH